MPTIAFIGAGPTTIYTLHALVDRATRPFAVTIFEEQPVAGRGTPYRPGWNDPAMLSNIASIEIPPLEETLVAWLARQSADRLIALGVNPDGIDDRAFYPRLALGAYFKDQFDALVSRATSHDIPVDIQTRCRVTDVANDESGFVVSTRSGSGEAGKEHFDYLVLATGHQWPEPPEVRPGYFLSPWPASALAEIPPCKVGIRGSSLTAIDAVVALAVSNGEFVTGEQHCLIYSPAFGTDDFHMTMISRKGLLPEADFYHPVPYEPLSTCTPEAIQRLINSADSDLLDQTFALFTQELASIDPAYARGIGLADLSLDTFCDAYFAEREAVDPFVWAERNLEEAERNQAEEVTVPWRYAILRLHEVIALIVPHLNEDQFERFSRCFGPVFTDEYATVPHDSIKRMLALNDASKLDVIAAGEDYRIDNHRPEGGVSIQIGDQDLDFPVFVEATGQRPLGTKDFPFPTLIEQGIVRDEQVMDADCGPTGIVVDDRFHPISDNAPVDRLYCLSLPYILGRHPFIQGITSSQELGSVVGKALAAAIDRDADPRQAKADMKAVAR